MTKLKREGLDAGEKSGQPERSVARTEGLLELDEEGVPLRNPVADWLDLGKPGQIPEGDVTRWLLAVLRFCRPDGSPVFEPRGRSVSRLRAIEAWSRTLGDPSLSAVIERWLPSRTGATISPSLPPCPPTLERTDRWRSSAPIGQRVATSWQSTTENPGDRTMLDVSARGQTWLGPFWTSPRTEGKVGPARPSFWTSGAFADCAEWSYRNGRGRTTRTVVLLRGRDLALLGQQDDGGGGLSQEIRLALPDGIEAATVAGSRSLLLSSGRGKPTARLIPLGLPPHDRPTDLGSIAIEGREVVVRQNGDGPRRWLPVLLCWGKAPASWRALTVSSRSKVCQSREAVASRVAWGLYDEGLVVYRSLAPPALRSFLGHQTGARFLVGAFTRSGDVRPILKIDA